MYKVIMKLESVLNSFLMFVSMAFLGIGTLWTFVATILRYGWGIGFDWSEEAIRYMMLVPAFWLAGKVLLLDENVNLSVVVNMIKNKKVISILEDVSTIVTGVVGVFMTKWGIDLFIASKGMKTLSTRFPQQLPYAILPIGMALLVVYAFIKIALKYSAPKEYDAENIEQKDEK